jgi:hypothetical protein
MDVSKILEELKAEIREIEDVPKTLDKPASKKRGLEEPPPAAAAAVRVPRPKPKPTLPPAAVAMPVEETVIVSSSR